jgi:hypothetical protein
MVLLVFLIVTVLSCFAFFSSLRVYRRKRNWIIYAFIALLLGSVAFEAYDTSLGTAVVTYSFESAEDRYHAGRTNQFNIVCTSLSQRQTSFDLIVKATNASLLVLSEQGYTQINSTTIKIPFTLSGLHQTQSRNVQFTIDQNVSTFDLRYYVDYQRGGPASTGGTAGVHCVYNSAINAFAITKIFGPSI